MQIILKLLLVDYKSLMETLIKIRSSYFVMHLFIVMLFIYCNVTKWILFSSVNKSSQRLSLFYQIINKRQLSVKLELDRGDIINYRSNITTQAQRACFCPGPASCNNLLQHMRIVEIDSVWQTFSGCLKCTSVDHTVIGAALL